MWKFTRSERLQDLIDRCSAILDALARERCDARDDATARREIDARLHATRQRLTRLRVAARAARRRVKLNERRQAPAPALTWGPWADRHRYAVSR